MGDNKSTDTNNNYRKIIFEDLLYGKAYDIIHVNDCIESICNRIVDTNCNQNIKETVYPTVVFYHKNKILFEATFQNGTWNVIGDTPVNIRLNKLKSAHYYKSLYHVITHIKSY